MEAKSLIDSMKELIRCYEICNDPNSPIQRELTMWRKRFLQEQWVAASSKRKDYEECHFLFVPSETLMKHDVEEYFKQI